TTPGNENLADLNKREIIAIAPIIALIIALGFYPKPALDVINPAAANTVTKAGLSDPKPIVKEGGK
ncbi:MAG: NADH-quinone oxidoreductase subunit M, partial [Actinomycetota bacterium]